jgi:murein DD-endopeptidase MepM/ murein hydrolase activator NlpD
MKKGLLVLLASLGWFCASNAHALTAFPGDQDTVHLYPFVCAPGSPDAIDTIGGSTLQNVGGVTYPTASGAGFCNAYSVSGQSRLFANTDVPGNFGTLVFTVTFVDHAAQFSFIDWTSSLLGYHVLIFRDPTNHMCIYMADFSACSNTTYADGVEYHFAVTYRDDAQSESNNPVKLYDSADGLLLTRPFHHIGNASSLSFTMGGINTDLNPGPSTLLSQVFIENRPWTDQEVQNYFNAFVANNPTAGRIVLNGAPLVAVPVLRLNKKLVRQELARTDVAGNYFFTTFAIGDYIMPVSSGTVAQSDDTNEGPHGYTFVPEFCQVQVKRRECATDANILTQDFFASAKPAPLEPLITFKLPLRPGTWPIGTEAGGYVITAGQTDADPSHTDLSSGFYALDFPGPCGTPVLAPSDGKVVFAGENGDFGLAVVLQHTQEIYTLYAHLDSKPPSVRKGTQLSQGSTVGFMGSSGKSIGPHLHFQLYDGGFFDRTKSQSGDQLIRRMRLETGNGVFALVEFVAAQTYSSTNTSGQGTAVCLQTK